ncbi:biopolymer transporter ExbD [Rhodobacteraceae bacterium ASV31]|nr:biopolymer transporter ExbD [Anianabacter salinae]MBV0912471.1 biopolymer transporter ExbD [Anianabacter salinae]
MLRPPRRRRLSLTPLIDVIVLLLLFFMLSSTFSRFGEVDLAGAGSAKAGAGAPPLFLKLSSEAASLNGAAVTLDALAGRLGAKGEERTLLVSPSGDVTAQRLTDALVAVAGVPALRVVVLGGS